LNDLFSYRLPLARFNFKFTLSVQWKLLISLVSTSSMTSAISLFHAYLRHGSSLRALCIGDRPAVDVGFWRSQSGFIAKRTLTTLALASPIFSTDIQLFKLSTFVTRNSYNSKSLINSLIACTRPILNPHARCFMACEDPFDPKKATSGLCHSGFTMSRNR
jgi:hypothetical protein